MPVLVIPTGTVTGQVVDVSGNPVQGALVRAELRAGNSTPQTISPAGQTVPSEVSTFTDVTGFWSLALVPNNNITPANSSYIISVPGMPDVQISLNDTATHAYLSLAITPTFATLSPVGQTVGALTITGPFLISGGILGPDPWYDVKAYGAKGDGVTDDTAAIQTALDLCRTAGGGVVFFPPGTYQVSTAIRTGGFAGNACALMYGSDTTIRGAGMDGTVVRLANSQPGNTTLANNLTAIFSPWNVNQDQITFQDLTIDGNAGNQTDTHSGILVWRQRGVRHHQVRVRNCRGTANAGGAAETFLFYALASGDVYHSSCEAAQTAGTCANGFVANGCTNVKYESCTAISIGAGAGIGFGFNVGTSTGASRQVAYMSCHAYLCGARGYHIDDASVKNVAYVACRAGGTASSTPTAQQYPFTQNQSLGNAGVGFLCAVAATAISYVDCVAENNGSHGWDLRAGEFELTHCSANGNGGDGFNHQTSPTIKAVALVAKNNTGSGINILSANSATNIRIVGGPILTGNTVSQLRIGGTNYAQPPANVAAPAVPASTVAQTNQFAHDATVHVTGGTVTVIAVNGVATGLIAGTFRVPAGGTITITYTVVPTWTWYLE